MYKRVRQSQNSLSRSPRKPEARSCACVFSTEGDFSPNKPRVVWRTIPCLGISLHTTTSNLLGTLNLYQSTLQLHDRTFLCNMNFSISSHFCIQSMKFAQVIHMLLIRRDTRCLQLVSRLFCTGIYSCRRHLRIHYFIVFYDMTDQFLWFQIQMNSYSSNWNTPY